MYWILYNYFIPFLVTIKTIMQPRGAVDHLMNKRPRPKAEYLMNYRSKLKAELV